MDHSSVILTFTLFEHDFYLTMQDLFDTCDFYVVLLGSLLTMEGSLGLSIGTFLAATQTCQVCKDWRN